jgi:hypothetical protein
VTTAASRKYLLCCQRDLFHSLSLTVKEVASLTKEAIDWLSFKPVLPFVKITIFSFKSKSAYQVAVLSKMTLKAILQIQPPQIKKKKQTKNTLAMEALANMAFLFLVPSSKDSSPTLASKVDQLEGMLKMLREDLKKVNIFSANCPICGSKSP